MSDSGPNSDLYVISTSPSEDAQNCTADTEKKEHTDQQDSRDAQPTSTDRGQGSTEQAADIVSAAASAAGAAITAPKTDTSSIPPKTAESEVPPPKGKNKRSRKAAAEPKEAAIPADTEDINLHVEAGWSEDEKYEKEPAAKRVAAEGADGSTPVASSKKASIGPLDNFTVRAVVTRKDVEVIFEQREGAKEQIESETGSSITIVAGKDDPDIVVDRVLVVKGPIDNVSAAYKIITEGMLAIKQSAAKAKSAKQGAATKDAAKREGGDDAEHDGEHDGEDDEEEEEDDDGDDDDDGDGDDAKSDAEQNNGDKPSTAADTDNAAADTGATADSGTSVVTNAAAASVVATADGDNTARDATSGVAKETAADTETPAADTEKKPAEKPATKKSKYREDPSTRITLRMLVPHKCVGSIMGHGGKTINNIREASFVSIHTSETTLPRSSERIVAVIGTPKSIQKAIGLVAQALTKDMVSYNSTDHYVPAANLPSAMTVETHSRKRKDGNKRTGQNNNNNNNDHHPGNRGHSNNNSNSNNSHNHHHNNNRNSGARHNNHGQGGNFGNNRHQGNQRGGNSNYGNQMNYGRNQNNSGVIRHERHSRHNNDRMTGRNRAPNMMSPANRMPINAGPSQQGGLSQNQHGNNYRSSNMNNRPVSAPSAPYGGYNPPPTTTHPVYSAQGGRGNNTNSNVGGNVGGAGAGGVAGMHHSRYGGGNSAVSPVQAPSGYGTAGGYGATPAAYPFTAPANYGYPVSPVQNMYNNRAAQQPTSGPYNQRAFNTRGNRPQMQQQQQPQQQPHHQQYQNQYQHPVQNQNQHYQAPMGMGGGNAGAAGGGVPAANTAGQTIQQIYVPGDKVGAVIGRRGETINEIRHSTNARVDIQDSAPGAKERLIVISGGYDQVHSAYYMIKNKIDMARPATMRP